MTNYEELATSDSLKTTVNALKEKGYEVSVVKSKQEALNRIKEIIPKNSSLMNGSSVTLEQIGYQDFLKSEQHEWVDLHAKVNAENDKEKRRQLRRQSVHPDFYLGSVHALTENGDFVIASNSGSQLPHVVYTSPNLIFVVSTKKIVPTLADAYKRVEEHVVPLEDKHMKRLYNVGTALNKIVTFKGESKSNNRKISFILVEENLGF